MAVSSSVKAQERVIMLTVSIVEWLFWLQQLLLSEPYSKGVVESGQHELGFLLSLKASFLNEHLGNRAGLTIILNVFSIFLKKKGFSASAVLFLV